VCILLVGVGLAASAYLLARLFALLGSPRPGSFDLCAVLFSKGCDAALSDERSWILGVPLAGWGLVYFTSLGGLLFLARFMGQAFEAEALLAGSLVTLAGVGVGVALATGALLGQAPLCPLCLSVHAISLLLLLALRQASARSLPEQVRLLRAASGWLIGSGAETPLQVRWKLVGFASVALLAVVAYQWVYVESALRRPRAAPTQDRAQIIAAYRASPAFEIPVTESDPQLGPLTAPVELVVFGSFRCSGCRRFASTISQLHRQFGDRLLIVYKHYPLSTRCNGRLTEDLQPGACELAWAAEAAHRQARFWEFHDALFAARAAAPEETIAEVVRRLNLDPARFAADRQSEITKGQVADDVELGNRLEIPGTPAVFLDGRPVRPARGEVLTTLIRHELERHAEGSLSHGRAIAGVGRFGDQGRPP